MRGVSVDEIYGFKFYEGILGTDSSGVGGCGIRQRLTQREAP